MPSDCGCHCNIASPQNISHYRPVPTYPPSPPANAMANPAELIHGPAFVGIIFNILLYGVVINQTFTYYSVFRNKDRMGMQIFVAVLFVADTLNTIFNIIWIYGAVIKNFGNFASLEYADLFLASDAAMTAIIAAMVQTFFAWRVKILTQNLWITGLIAFLAFCNLVAGVGSAIINRNFYPKFADFQKYSYIVIPWLVFSAVCDVVITVALTWNLKKRSGFRSDTDDILNKIIRVTIQNGAVTTICAIIDIVLFLTVPTGAHLTFNFALAKLYTNSALSSLNSRSGLTGTNLANMNDSSQSHSRHRPSLGILRKQGDVIDLRAAGPRQPTITEVYVDVETHEMKDLENGTYKPGASSQWEIDPNWKPSAGKYREHQAS